MARGVAELVTRMTMDANQALSEAGKFTGKLGSIGTAAKEQLRDGLGGDLVEIQKGFLEAGNKAEFLEGKIGDAAVALGALGPIGLAAGAAITFARANGSLAETVKLAAEAEQRLRGLAPGLDFEIKARTPDLTTLRQSIIGQLGFSLDDIIFGGAASPADILGDLAGTIKANEGDVRAAAADIGAAIIDEAQFSNDLQTLANAGLESLVTALKSGKNRDDVIAAAAALAADIPAAMALQDQIDGALAAAVPVLSANVRGEVYESWRRVGVESAQSFNAGFASVPLVRPSTGETLRRDAQRRGTQYAD